MEITEVTPVSLAYLVLGGFVVAFSMISLLVKEKLYIGEVVLGTAFGVIIGPHCANIFNPRAWGGDTNTVVTLEFLRIVLATGLFAIGVELPKAYLAEHARSLLVMVVPTMAFGWVVSAGILFVLFPNINFISALVISACLTPTDPILAAAIIGGKFAIKNVPGHIRRLLAAESAANDGLAYPFLSISLYLTLETSKRVAIGKWFLIGWLYQVILGTVLGAVLGLAFSYLMRISHRRGLIDRESFLSQYLALAIFTIGIASSIGSDDLLAAFAAGSAVSWDGHFNTHTEHEVFSSVLDLLLNCACFIYIGAWLPFESYQSSTLGITPWRLVVLFVAILFLRRIPSLLLMYKWVPDIMNWREALFCGHFGPMGVGAIFISTLAITRLPTPHDPPRDQQEFLAASLQPIVSFIVLCSILIHGLSIPAWWFGRKTYSRTVSMSGTWSRTITSRQEPPDWLLWARRPALLALPAPRNSSTPDIEGGANNDSLPTSPNYTDSGKATITSRLTGNESLENRKSRLEKKGSPPISAPRTRASTPLPSTSNSESFDTSNVNTSTPEFGGTGSASRGNETSKEAGTPVNTGHEEDIVGDVAGYGYASLHDKKEDVEESEKAKSGNEPKQELNDQVKINEGPSSATVTKQVQFAQ